MTKNILKKLSELVEYVKLLEKRIEKLEGKRKQKNGEIDKNKDKKFVFSNKKING